jgi:hypothetical protein
LQYKVELERILTRQLRRRQPQIGDVKIIGNNEFAVYNVGSRYTVRKLSGMGKEFLRSGQLTSGSPEDYLVTDLSVNQRSKQYRCRDCGGEVGIRSRRRKWIERYLLPMIFLKPVRCASCFRRDYWLVSTPVCERVNAAIELTHYSSRKAA